MKYVLLLVTLCASFSLSAAYGIVETIEGGRSPNAQLEVVNIVTPKTSDEDYPNPERHFEIRDKSGQTVISELSLKDLTDTNDSGKIFAFADAGKVLWRPDSRMVAISTRTSKFATLTVVFACEGNSVKRVEIPEYEPFVFDPKDPEMFGSSDTTHREPYRWRKNGDLILDITMGYHTKSDGGITGYYATVHFSGNPPKAVKGSQTKETERD